MGLVGESGCGKTTLARAILGILPANAQHEAGAIRFRGEDLLTMPRRRVDAQIRGRAHHLHPAGPVRLVQSRCFRSDRRCAEVMKWKSPRRAENAGRGMFGFFSRYPRARRKADRRRWSRCCGRCRSREPTRRSTKLPHEFSGGQRQRLMIALALMPQPDLVIADEPTTALDVTIQAQILKLLKRLAKERGVSVLFTTHDLGTAYEICDRITVMYAGQEVETAPVDDFFQRPSHPYTVRLLESLPKPGPRPARDRRRDSGTGRSAGRLPLPSALHARERRMPYRTPRQRRSVERAGTTGALLSPDRTAWCRRERGTDARIADPEGRRCTRHFPVRNAFGMQDRRGARRSTA